MKYRLHGKPEKLVLHGGPGAIGSVSNLAIELNNCIEVLNYGQSIEAQIREIKDIIQAFDMKSPTIIGHSWGAWLAYLYAAQYDVGHLILIGCGPFKPDYLKAMNERRQNKLTEVEMKKADYYFDKIGSIHEEELFDFGQLMAKMDSYDLEGYKDQLISFDAIGHQLLMDELRHLRASGQLLELGRTIDSRVTVIHGKEDPHPYLGVVEPLKSIGLDLELILLEQCGHAPWIEKYAKEKFYSIMETLFLDIIETDRLRLRPFHILDEHWFAEMNADIEVMTYFPQALDLTASNQLLKRIIESHKKQGYGLWALELKSDQTPLGFVGLSHPRFEASFTPCIEIGWRLRKEHWHKGYAKESAQAVLDYGFDVLGLKQVYSFTSKINLPSIALMRRIGLNYIESFDHPNVVGKLQNHVLYGLEKSK